MTTGRLSRAQEPRIEHQQHSWAARMQMGYSAEGTLPHGKRLGRPWSRSAGPDKSSDSGHGALEDEVLG